METEFTFQTLTFAKTAAGVHCTLLRMFAFDIAAEKLDAIAPWRVENGTIIFSGSEQRCRRKFWEALTAGFGSLTNVLRKKPAVYIHQGSGIPLIGNIAFGLVDRGTNVIEMKPISGCNIRCNYCSVDEDARSADMVVESVYLVEEFAKLAAFKAVAGLEAHINSQGEPTLYADMIELVKGIAAVPNVSTISIDTNGLVLTPKLVDRLVESGLTRFNLSINAIDPVKAKAIADAPYDIEHVKKIAAYIASKCDLIIAPTLVPGWNDEEMPKIIEFTKPLMNGKHKVTLGIQNFLHYSHGRNIVKSLEWEQFFTKLKAWETEFGVKLRVSAGDYNIFQTKELPKPFRKGQVVEAIVACIGRLPGEKIAVAGQRCISVFNSDAKPGEKVRIKLMRTKHNIFAGAVVG